MSGYCDTCLNQHKPQACEYCSDNPKYFYLGSHYTPYLEVCPIKEWGCPDDPAFMKYYFPKRFEKKFGDITPKEAVKHENSKCVNCPWKEDKK